MNSTPSHEEFEEIIKPIIENKEIQKMKYYMQHADVSCFEHCKNVAYYSYYICKKLNLDYKSAARASMLHDFFLYDWRLPATDRKGFHAFTHPRTSLDNALKYFELNDKEKDIILKHMWPVTIKLPKYKESYIITLTDKFSALFETMKYYNKKPGFQKIYSNFVIFLAILFLKS